MSDMNDMTHPTVFSEELLDEAFAAEIRPLLYQHWREIAHYPDIELAVDWDSYYRAQAAGMLKIYTARALDVDGENWLVGYAVFVLSRHLHYDVVNAKQDVLFLLPEYRDQGTGAGLIAFADMSLAAAGASVVYNHVKRAHDFGPLLRRLGYEEIESVWGRRLDRAGQPG